jgi:ribosomal protein L3 glutamine methyltransferase
MSSFGEKLAQVTEILRKYQVFCGHGYESIHDEAVALVLGAAELTPDQTMDLLDQPFPQSAEPRLQELLHLRGVERLPLAYALGEAWLAGVRFRCDARALVPRSPIAAVLIEGCQPWWSDDREPKTIVDVCCGGGSLGIIAAHVFCDALVILSDIDRDALSLASENVQLTAKTGHVVCCRGDLLHSFPNASIDLVLANPPYVCGVEMAQLHPEYDHEPRLALEAAEDGTALAVELLHEAARVLAPDGLLILEVGETAAALERRLPRIPFTWVDLPDGGSGVAAVSAQELRDWRAAGIL